MFPDPMSLRTTNEERQVGPKTPGRRWVFEEPIGSSRDDATSIFSSRALLITMLGEMVRPHDGAAWTQTMIDAMTTVGVSEKATRQLLARLDDQGWLRRTRSGRRTRWHLTGESIELLDAGAERIYDHGHVPKPWDGRWSVVVASVPDGGGDRHRLSVGLKWAGYGALGRGLWISPWSDRDAEAAATVARAGVTDATSFIAEVAVVAERSDLGDERCRVRHSCSCDRGCGFGVAI